jgi:hypothetical protein
VDKTFFPRIRTKAEFDEWLEEMREGIAFLTSSIAFDDREKLDYSQASLIWLEQWILDKYISLKDAHNPEGIRLLDGAGRYVGETFRAYLQGEWVVELDDKTFAYLGFPGITNFQNNGAGLKTIYPQFWVTASIGRRTNHFIADRFEVQLKNRL